MNLFKSKDIIYEDEEILVCRKHANMAVQNAKSTQMDLESALKNYLALKTKSIKNQIPYLGIIQRLDQPVEGVIVFAKTPASAANLTQQLQQGKIQKFYLAMVAGPQVPKHGTLEDYLQKNGRTNISKVVQKGSPGAKRALLDYRCIRQDENTALLEIHLMTGRHHQIRVQLSHADMPIIGDQKYNPAAEKGIPLCLCAYKLELYHPRKYDKMVFEIKPENIILEREERKEIP